MAKSLGFCLAVVCICAAAVSAQTSLPFVSNAFGDNMVLQANGTAHIWGWAQNPTALVKVELKRGGSSVQVYYAQAENGYWIAHLVQPISFVPADIHISTPDGAQSATIQNVLFGQVYICGGQSNMQMSVSGAFNGSEEVSKADHYPNIRFFTAGQGTASSEPLSVFKTITQPWSIASSKAAGGKVWDYFSATCWFFGRDLYDQMPVKAPIGLMSINWGGTYIQTWSSPTVQRACKDTEPPAAKPPNQPGLLYNSMLTPVFGMAVDGILWYQGESNVGFADVYECFFPTMIADWRARQNPDPSNPFSDIPFFFVQLSPYSQYLDTKNPLQLPQMREAQMAAFKVPKVSGVTAIDAGDPSEDNPLGNIHPRNKQVLGARLASAMLRSQKGVYGIQGPLLKSATTIPGSQGQVTLLFDTESPLKLVSATCPSGINTTFCSAFQLQGSDSQWRNADATLGTAPGGNTLILNAPFPAGVSPIHVRYAYNIWPLAILYDINDYPAWPINQRVY